MNNFLNTLEIKNFKSIKQLKANCKRVNVFIGKPNVGKSNILEAISLLGAHYANNENKYLSEFIRYEELSNLFYDDDVLRNINIITDKVTAIVRYHADNTNVVDITIGESDFIGFQIGSDSINHHNNRYLNYLNEKRPDINHVHYSEPYYQAISLNSNSAIYHSNIPLSTNNPIKKYQFKDASLGNNKFPTYLLPPNGVNLFTIVDHNKELRKEIVEIFKEYGLNFVGYKKENTFEIEKNIDGYINKYHYSSIADTFQRLIFYFAAIDSNKDSVLILEEPEVHSFPPYTRDLSQRIIESTENQFFITTHSPYLLQNLIESLGDEDLNVFITYFEGYETKIKCLSADELKKVSEFSIDLFYNLDNFIK